MKSLKYCFARVVRVELDVVAHRVSGKQAIYAPRRNEFLFNDGIEKGIAFAEYLARLRTLFLVLKNAGINPFQPPGVEERCPVNELAQRFQRKVVKNAYADKTRRGHIFSTPCNRCSPRAGDLKRDDRLPRCSMSLAKCLVFSSVLGHKG